MGQITNLAQLRIQIQSNVVMAFLDVDKV